MLSCTVKGFMTASWALPFTLDPVLVIGHHRIKQTNKQSKQTKKKQEANKQKQIHIQANKQASKQCVPTNLKI